MVEAQVDRRLLEVVKVWNTVNVVHQYSGTVLETSGKKAAQMEFLRVPRRADRLSSAHRADPLDFCACSASMCQATPFSNVADWCSAALAKICGCILVSARDLYAESVMT